MDLYLMGDCITSTGPGIANKEIKKSLEIGYKINCSSNNKIILILSLYNQIKNSDILVICSFSKMNYIAIKIAKKLQKKILYIMHGCATYEKKINDPLISIKQLNKIEKLENYIFENVDKIVCVSKYFMDFMRTYKKEYYEKYDFIFNIVDIKNKNSYLPKKKQVFSTGGGMIRKNNYKVACAIENLSCDFEYIIAGLNLEDGNKLREKNVCWKGEISHDEVIKLMSESYIYVQNSRFETFGLAVIEALYCGCNILISNNVGCKDLFSTLIDDDIIFNVDNENEISEKIDKLIKNGNNERLRRGFLKEAVTRQWQLKKFQNIIGDLDK